MIIVLNITGSVTQDHIRRAYLLVHLRTDGSEVDFLIVLSKLRCIMQVEVYIYFCIFNFMRGISILWVTTELNPAAKKGSVLLIY